MTVSWLPITDNAKYLLAQATQNWQETTNTDHFIEQAIAETSAHPDVLVAAYRYFFYKNNCPKALEVANRVVTQVRSAENLPEEWDQLKPILEAGKENPTLRLFLNAYSATGLLLAKLGDLDQALTIATQIKSIDHKNEFGADVILSILTHSGDDDDDEAI